MKISEKFWWILPKYVVQIERDVSFDGSGLGELSGVGIDQLQLSNIHSS